MQRTRPILTPRLKSCAWQRQLLVVSMLGMSCLFAFSAATAAPPKKPSSSSQSKKPKANPVTTAQKEMVDANNQLGFAKLRLQQAIRAASQARQDVQKEHDSAPGLQAARRLRGEHQQEMEAEKKAIRDELAYNSTYQEALRKKEETKQRINSLSAPESPEGKAAFAAYQEATKQIRDLENEAFTRNTKVKTMLTEAAQEEEEIRELVKGRNAAIQNDPRLANVKNEITQAKAAVAIAEQQALAAKQKLVLAQQEYARQAAAKAAANTKKKPAKGRKPPKR
jgi:hypothetical protein